MPEDANLLVGLATADDAGVYRISDSIAVVQTVDFFTPIVDDPYLFGLIAAANSLSDVYAMGGRPLTALNIVCFPIRDRDPNELAAILRGGSDKLAEAGCALLGGHSVEDPEPKYGLAVTGMVDPNHIATNAAARPGDVLVLTKPIGTGILTTAAKFDECPPEALEAACASMAALNAGAAAAMRAMGIGPDQAVSAATDITGFGLLGHLYQLARASGVGISLSCARIPVLPSAREMAAAGNVTRGDGENRAYLGGALQADPDVDPLDLNLLLDPQTSGGLAICVAESEVERLLQELERNGTPARALIGRAFASPEPVVQIRA